MSTLTKRPSAAKSKTAAKPKTAAKRPAKAQTAKAQTAVRATRSSKTTAQPFLRFYHSDSLRAKTLGILDDLEAADDSTAHRKALADVAVELTESGMDYYFLRALKLADSGFMVQQSAKIGMSATTSVLGSVIRNIVGGMDERQLLAVSAHIRELMK
jgi:hypothetical protein